VAQRPVRIALAGRLAERVLAVLDDPLAPAASHESAAHETVPAHDDLPTLVAL
jgi:hypothetical protein